MSHFSHLLESVKVLRLMLKCDVSKLSNLTNWLAKAADDGSCLDISVSTMVDGKD